MIFISADGSQVLQTVIREKLNANRTYYVRTDGNDNNDGSANDALHALATPQGAVNKIYGLDLSGFTVTISVAAGTYTSTTSIATQNTRGNIIIQGDTTTPANVVINTSDSCFIVSYCKTPITITGFDMRSSAGSCVYNLASWVTWGAVIFGAAASGAHVWTVYGGMSWCSSNYTINGSTSFHVVCQFESFVQIANNTVTLSGTPAFTNAFLNCYHLAYFLSTGTTWSGAATGTRYTVGMNAGCYVGGAGANYLPGNSAGGTGNGGQYA